MKIVLFFLAIGVAAAQITEVMYNPPGSDNNLEYIEVCGYNLDGWIIGDSESNDTLVQLTDNRSECALIVEEGFDCTNYTCYSAGATIGNNLANTADCIYLYDNVLVDSMCYDGSLANGNGLALELAGEWIEGFSPGTSDQFSESADCTCNVTDNIVDEVTYNTESNATVESNANIQINTTNGSTYLNISIEHARNTSIEHNFSNTSHQHNSTINSTQPNQILNQTVSTEDSLTCTNLSIIAAGNILEQGEKLEYWIKLDNVLDSFALTYWVEDLQGKVVKSPHTSTNTNKRSWTPNCGKGTAFVVRAQLENCTSNAEMLVGIACPQSIETNIDDDVRIVKVVPSNAAFGNTVQVELKLSKGATTKSAIEVYVDGASQKTKINLESKNTNARVIVPVQLVPNCDWKLDNGTYDVVVAGLGEKDQTAIEIFGNNCPKKEAVVECEQSNIKSFYTLAKKYSDKINLQANIDCPDNCTIVLFNSTGPVLSRNAASGKISITAAPNNYSLALCSPLTEFTLPFEIPKAISKKKTEDAMPAPIKAIPTSYKSKSESRKGSVKYFILAALGLLGGLMVFRKI